MVHLYKTKMWLIDQICVICYNRNCHYGKFRCSPRQKCHQCVFKSFTEHSQTSVYFDCIANVDTNFLDSLLLCCYFSWILPASGGHLIMVHNRPAMEKLRTSDVEILESERTPRLTELPEDTRDMSDPIIPGRRESREWWWFDRTRSILEKPPLVSYKLDGSCSENDDVKVKSGEVQWPTVTSLSILGKRMKQLEFTASSSSELVTPHARATLRRKRSSWIFMREGPTDSRDDLAVTFLDWSRTLSTNCP